MIESSLRKILEQEDKILFGFLFGSQVTAKTGKPGDWDFAAYWDPGLDFWEKLGQVETLRDSLAKKLGVLRDQVDLVDLNNAGLSICSSVVEHGIVLKGEGTLLLERFYRRVWALEEDFYWRLNIENRRISG